MRALAAVRSILALVPAPYERIEWRGRPGIVMERVLGRDELGERIGRDAAIPDELRAAALGALANLPDGTACESAPCLPERRP